MNAVPYDSAGRQLMANGNTLAYDAENRQTSVTSPGSTGGGTETYAYDGNGHRVEKSGPGGTTVCVYDAFGQLAAEYATALPNTPPCTTCYISADHLGSVRLVTDQTGNVVSRHDYLPFGEEIAGNAPGRNSQFGATDNLSQRFTGKERDGESGLDYFGTRYYGSTLGRFTRSILT
jgi:RHS repeat-associated protein